MENAKDDAARVRLMLIEYASELANETPVLRRFTDCIPAPDGLGGCEEMEADRAYREAIRHPKDGLTLAACVDCLNALRDAPTAFDAVRDELNKHGCETLAEDLAERRNRRAADIERMKGEAVRIAPAMDLPPDLRVCDFDGWDAAAQTFNDGIVTDIEYVQTAVAETLVAAFKAAAQFALPPDVSHKGARAVLEWLNDQVGIIPPVKLDGMTVPEIFAALEKRYADATSTRAVIAELNATVRQEADAIRKDFANVGDTMCEIVGKKRMPPEPDEVGEISRRELYDLAKSITTRRGNLDTFLNKTTWTFRGFNAREIYKDVDGLRRFMETQRMWNKRHPK